MAEKLMFKYDREADILYIDKQTPYAEQETEELGDDVIARLNPTTGEVETLEIFFFSKLYKKSVTEILQTLKDAGMDSMPGGGAEIFNKETRNKIIKGKAAQVHPLMWITAALFVLYFAIDPVKSVLGV